MLADTAPTVISPDGLAALGMAVKHLPWEAPRAGWTRLLEAAPTIFDGWMGLDNVFAPGFAVTREGLRRLYDVEVPGFGPRGGTYEEAIAMLDAVVGIDVEACVMREVLAAAGVEHVEDLLRSTLTERTREEALDHAAKARALLERASREAHRLGLAFFDTDP